MKTVVIYDKWLHSLGGGEVVACNIAKILKDKGYKVIFVSGKEVSKETILNKLKTDLKGIEFKQVWNDEIALKNITKDKDLFINISFMDYSIGFAKKNIYYANFPTRAYNDFYGMFITKILVPIVSHFITPLESLSQIDATVVIHEMPAYLLVNENKYALSQLTIGKTQRISFAISIENFFKSFLENIKIDLENSQIVNTFITINHNTNTIKFTYEFIPTTTTAYLNLSFKDLSSYHSFDPGKVYLLYPKIKLSKISRFLFSDILAKFTARMRAGIFINVIERLGTYQKTLTYSIFAKKWIQKYWDTDALVIAPPVDLLFKKYNLQKNKKKNWICSVGRFFTLGHGKKQEILIEAFKNLYNKDSKNWELHLVGGLGDEPSSIEFFKYLKEKSKGYPIFFHINVSGQEVEDIYLKSKVYWHATGFGEDEGYRPVRFEHFGIAPIEALSAKCIPILFNGGGLPEIISTLGLDKAKHLFTTVDELVDNTIYFQNDKNYQLDWQTIFKQADLHYSKQAFKRNFMRFLSSLK